MKLLETLLHELEMRVSFSISNEIGSIFKDCPKIGEGSSRTVYDLKNGYIAKIPIFMDIEYNTKTCTWEPAFSGHRFKKNSQCNFYEYLLYRNSKDLPLLPCDLYFYKEMPIIVMEKVDGRYAATKDIETPKGAGKFADGFQAGVTKDGRYLAYDYGYEESLLEREMPGFDISKAEYELFSSLPQNFMELMHSQTELALTP
jgi:hypothetical protein